MRRFMIGLAILTTGAVGMIGTVLLLEQLTNQVLGPGHDIADWAPVMQAILMVPVVLPPLLVAGILLPRGRTTEVGLFLLGWGCLWPAFIAYLVVGTILFRVAGGAEPNISVDGGPVATVINLFFIVLPLAGAWFLTAGLRQRRAHRSVSQT